MKVFIKVATIAQIDGRIESLGPGHVLDLPDDVARGLVKAGHAQEVKRGSDFERAVHPVVRP